MTHEVLYFTLWLMVTVATLWDIRRTQRYMRASEERMEQAAREIAQFLGSDRR